MKKFAAVIAISVACTTSAFAQGYGYAPAPCPPPAPVCAPVSYGTPCVDPVAPVAGVLNGVGSFVSHTVNGFANLFGCNPC